MGRWLGLAMSSYIRDEPIGTTILLGDRRDRLYVLRGHVVRPGAGAGGWLSESENEDDAAFDRYGSEEESDSLQSTGRKLSQSNDGTYEQLDEACCRLKHTWTGVSFPTVVCVLEGNLCVENPLSPRF